MESNIVVAKEKFEREQYNDFWNLKVEKCTSLSLSTKF